MLSILLKISYMMVLTIVIGFLLSLIIKLIVFLINFSGSIQKYDHNYLKEVARARSIKKIRIRRMYHDTDNYNEIIYNRYGSNFDNQFKPQKNNNSNELIEHFYGK